MSSIEEEAILDILNVLKANYNFSGWEIINILTNMIGNIFPVKFDEEDVRIYLTNANKLFLQILENNKKCENNHG